MEKDSGDNKLDVLDYSNNENRSNLATSRRQFLKGIAATTVMLALSGPDRILAEPSELKLPPPSLSKIEHIVVVMMENRSFDHFLGWLPGADGKQEGLTYFDKNNIAYSTYHLTDYQGCDHPDPDHSYTGGRIEYNGGACDGWLRAGNNDIYSIGYYNRSDLPFLGEAALSWTTCSRYFAAILAETFPNRIFQHAAQTDRLDNSTTISTLPTIWDRLSAAGVSSRYYYSDIPFLALWGSKYIPISRPFDLFLADCFAGTLPQVSFVEPRFLEESSGTSGDDHPHADIRNGEVFLNQVYKAVTTSPVWPNTLLIINYDEWGGFFEHIPPPRAKSNKGNQINNDGLRGFRVPCLLISPWSRRGQITSNIYDHNSILKLIEWRWHLDALTVRDATANNIAEALDLSQSNLSVPDFNVPTGPFGEVCLSAIVPNEWIGLIDMARSFGWPI